MSAIVLEAVDKRFHTVQALDRVSFSVPSQSIFGILGPNGAGKTTAIRIMTTILKPDQGQVYFYGAPLCEAHAHQMGYMPEERGLYRRMKVWEQLVYLARLKGLTHQQAKAQVYQWMELFEIKGWWKKKVQDLSKGMSQKVQFIATIAHNPRLIILDEPFSGLDPINTRLLESVIFQLRDKGATIMLSTHRMEQVEELCEYIVLIDKGKVLLEGKVAEVRRRYKKNEYLVRYEGDRPVLPDHFPVVREKDHELVVHMPADLNGNDLLKELLAQPILVTAFSELLPSLNDIFIEQVTRSEPAHG